jgi:hypothetical protein
MPYYKISLRMLEKPWRGKWRFQGIRFTPLTDEGKFNYHLWKLCNHTFRTFMVEILYEQLPEESEEVRQYLAALQLQGKKLPVLFPNPYNLK